MGDTNNIWNVRVEKESSVVSKKLAEIDLRKRFGITVLAIQRGQKVLYNPGADNDIQPGDYLFLMGKAEQIRAAAKTL